MGYTKILHIIKFHLGRSWLPIDVNLVCAVACHRLIPFMTQLHAPHQISDEPTRRCVKGNGELLSPRLNDLKNTKKIPLHNRLSQ